MTYWKLKSEVEIDWQWLENSETGGNGAWLVFIARHRLSRRDVSNFRRKTLCYL